MSAWNAPIGDDDLQAYVDGRLEASRTAFVAAWLDEQPETGQRVAADVAMRDELRARLDGKVKEPIPARLRMSNVLAARRRRLRTSALRIAASLLLFAAGGAAGWLGHDAAGNAPTELALLTSDALSAHRTFVVEVRHPVEVEAAQEAHLVQWLSKRLGRQLVAPDLARTGYRLVGGRLLPAESGPAAQLMYEASGGQRLTVYLRGEAQQDRTAFRFVEANGVGAFYWVDNGFGYAVAGAADREKLLQVAEQVYDQTLAVAVH